MLKHILLFAAALMPIATPVQADLAGVIRNAWMGNQSPAVPSIQALILHDQNSAILEVRGKYRYYDPYQKPKSESVRFVGKSQLIQSLRSGLKWGEEFPGLHQLSIAPAAPETEIIVNGTKYPGIISIYDIGGTISVVNELPIEEYLRLTLPSKAPQNIADEAMAAYVIAERTNAYYQALNPKSKYFSVDDTHSDYKGLIPVDPSTPVQVALRNTRNMVLSRTGLYEGTVTPFALQWQASGRQINPKGEISKITITEADAMAKKGDHAAYILDKAFPRSIIQIIPQ